MNRKKYIVYFIVLSFISFGPSMLVNPSWSDVNVDHSIYASLLQKYVQNGHVNYKGFKTEEAKLDQYLKVLERIDSKKLSRDEKFAFYANAYNAWTIKLILNGYPGVKSIKNLGGVFESPWKKKIVRIDGDLLTLDDIEHNILRPRFKDPRVHFAINCAALSCPPLRSEPYQGSILNQQLDDSTQVFINNPERNYLEGNTLYVSKIFKWFAEDFNHNPVDFVLKYAKDQFKKGLEAKKDKIKVKYLPYDWSLNGS